MNSFPLTWLGGVPLHWPATPAIRRRETEAGAAASCCVTWCSVRVESTRDHHISNLDLEQTALCTGSTCYGRGWSGAQDQPSWVAPGCPSGIWIRNLERGVHSVLRAQVSRSQGTAVPMSSLYKIRWGTRTMTQPELCVSTFFFKRQYIFF